MMSGLGAPGGAEFVRQMLRAWFAQWFQERRAEAEELGDVWIVLMDYRPVMTRHRAKIWFSVDEAAAEERARRMRVDHPEASILHKQASRYLLLLGEQERWLQTVLGK